ncbi:hypothetical protein TWF718_010830 [Orbilia javanica]|uniref:Peptidase A1 domain-containing protein n=1 Tax=Orbilia javanica TaxID=47235 RepID=A0AAN8MP31_9PEZI
MIVPNTKLGVSYSYNTFPFIGLGKGIQNESMGFYGPQDSIYSEGYSRGDNFISRMVAENKINTGAYSLYLSEMGDNYEPILESTLIFGGIDLAKFTRPLNTYKVLAQDNQTNKATSKFLQLNAYNVTTNDWEAGREFSGLSNLEIGIDFSEPTLNLPSAIIEKLTPALGLEEDGGKYYSTRLSTVEALELYLTGIGYDTNSSQEPLIVRIPIKDLIATPQSRSETTPTKTSPDRNERTPVLIRNGDNKGGIHVLGAPFFRAMYAIFDLDNDEISLAPALPRAKDENIVEMSGPVSSLHLGTPTPLARNTSIKVPLLVTIGICGGLSLVIVLLMGALVYTCRKSRQGGEISSESKAELAGTPSDFEQSGAGGDSSSTLGRQATDLPAASPPEPVELDPSFKLTWDSQTIATVEERQEPALEVGQLERVTIRKMSVHSV